MTAPSVPHTGAEPRLLAGPHEHTPRCWWDLDAADWRCPVPDAVPHEPPASTPAVTADAPARGTE